MILQYLTSFWPLITQTHLASKLLRAESPRSWGDGQAWLGRVTVSRPDFTAWAHLQHLHAPPVSWTKFPASVQARVQISMQATKRALGWLIRGAIA